MKWLLLASFLTIQNAWSIDDASFSNKDKYLFLKLESLSANPAIEFEIQFHPPEGKKVNTGSMIRLWEKTGKEWEIADKAYADGELSVMTEKKLTKTLTAKNIKADSAIEIDFIHCNYSGGQCQMQKYLGKMKRGKGIKENHLALDLKL
jgi:hypothetical protein